MYLWVILAWTRSLTGCGRTTVDNLGNRWPVTLGLQHQWTLVHAIDSSSDVPEGWKCHSLGLALVFIKYQTVFNLKLFVIINSHRTQDVCPDVDKRNPLLAGSTKITSTLYLILTSTYLVFWGHNIPFWLSKEQPLFPVACPRSASATS
jgi:hypothetical protein